MRVVALIALAVLAGGCSREAATSAEDGSLLGPLTVKGRPGARARPRPGRAPEPVVTPQPVAPEPEHGACWTVVDVGYTPPRPTRLGLTEPSAWIVVANGQEQKSLTSAQAPAPWFNGDRLEQAEDGTWAQCLD